MFEQMCEELTKAWDTIVRGGNTEVGEDELRIALVGGLVCIVEGGYLIPEAGKDQTWFADNLELIEKRAAAGHKTSMKMMDDVKAVRVPIGVLRRGKVQDTDHRQHGPARI